MNKRIVIYTAISGDYDVLRDPSVITPGFDYICFSDRYSGNKGCWNIRKIPDNDLDSVRKAKEMKVLPHRFVSDYDYSVWVDGSIDIIGNVRDLLEEYGFPPFLCFNHPSRNNAYEEGTACLIQAKDRTEVIRAQLVGYKSEGYPADNGLIDGCVLMRDHNNPHVMKVMEDWWNEIISKSRRDQLSFNYVAWKNKFSYVTIKDQNTRGESLYFINGCRHRLPLIVRIRRKILITARRLYFNVFRKI